MGFSEDCFLLHAITALISRRTRRTRRARGIMNGMIGSVLTQILHRDGPRLCLDRSSPAEANDPSNVRPSSTEMTFIDQCLQKRPGGCGNLLQSVRWKSRVRIEGLGVANEDLNSQEGRCGPWDGTRFTVYLESGRVLIVKVRPE